MNRLLVQPALFMISWASHTMLVFMLMQCPFLPYMLPLQHNLAVWIQINAFDLGASDDSRLLSLRCETELLRGQDAVTAA